MAYQRSDFGANPHAGRSRNNAAQRGWGSGWPNCQWGKFVVVERAGVRVSCRREVSELVATLFTATEQLGYNIRAAGDTACGGTWGTACRAIRGTDAPSNHSWGLAIDINAPCNPMASYFKTNIPPKVVKMWEACGWYWGGRYTSRPDTMHFEYVFRPADVAGHLKRAKAFLAGGGGSGGGSTEPPKFEPYRKGVKPGSRTVKRWDAGDDVAYLQRFIGDKAGKADGWFGPTTEAGVRWYQGMRKIAVDGVAGPKTWGQILSATPAPKPAPSRPTLRRGSTGQHVRDLQAHLKKVYPAYARHLVVDGQFGPKTEAAVKEFQRRSRITADGIVGRVTWARLGI